MSRSRPRVSCGIPPEAAHVLKTPSGRHWNHREAKRSFARVCVCVGGGGGAAAAVVAMQA